MDWSLKFETDATRTFPIFSKPGNPRTRAEVVAQQLLGLPNKQTQYNWYSILDSIIIPITYKEVKNRM